MEAKSFTWCGTKRYPPKPDNTCTPWDTTTLVRYRVGEAIQTLRETDGTFDLVFNDIDKEAYPEALSVIERKLRPGGVLIVDNLIWHGRVLDDVDQSEATQGVRELTRRVFESKRWIPEHRTDSRRDARGDLDARCWLNARPLVRERSVPDSLTGSNKNVTRSDGHIVLVRFLLRGSHRFFRPSGWHLSDAPG